MKFTADRAELAEAVKWVAGAISPKPSQPALGGIRLEAAPEGRVRLTAHDYDQVHTAVVDVVPTGTYEVQVAVPAGLMVRDLLGALRTKQVTVEADARRLTIKGGRSTYGVNLFAPGDWPEFPTGDATRRGVVDADDLRAGIAIAAAAADDDNPSQVLQGVRLEALGDTFDLIGLQGSRLSLGNVGYSGGTLRARLPIKNLAEAAKGLSGQVEISSSDGILTLADASRSVTLRLFEWADAPWRQLVKDRDQTVEVDADELTAAVRRAALAGGKESTLALSVNGGTLDIYSAGDNADGREEVDVTGDGVFSGTWGADVLGSVLSTLPSTSVSLSYEQTGSGGDVLAITDKAGSFHHVVMGRKAKA